jgi:hypothetical protein
MASHQESEGICERKGDKRVVFRYLNDDYLLNTELADADATDL